ncbi:MAG: CARDB domain-containing protein, partial [Desulfobulbus sp.]|nr:CARDB domain-containing protein [Desulfobulbus sp.]
MKKTAIAILLLLMASFVFADAYTIGTGTSAASAVPLNGYYDYSWSKVIYTQAEINDAGLTVPASFNGIGFYVGNAPNNYTMEDQRVYARHTAMGMYDTEDVEHPNFEDFQLLFQGDLTYNDGGWFYIVFSTPFAWDGSQNIEFLFENWDGNYVTGYPTFRYTSTTPDYKAVYKNQDNTFPAGINGLRTYNRPNIQLITPTTTPPDAAILVGPADGGTYISLQPTLTWASGNIWPDGYLLSLGTNNPPSNILDAEDIEGAVSYTHPTAFEHETTYYWQVVPYNDFGNASDCPVWSFTTHPDGFVTVGDGSANARMPLDFYYKSSLYQTLYYQDELGFVSGTVSAIKLYNQFSSNIEDTPVKIWMGSTNLSDLSGGYIPASQMELVFDGELNFPSGANDIVIALDTPYIHIPGNLVMMVLRPLDTSYYSSSDYFKCQTVGSDRARNTYSDSIVYDPLNPPAGTLTGQFPMTSFIYESGSITNDLACMGISGETIATADEEVTYTALVKNNGSATQGNYQVKLMQEGLGELVSVAGPTIESLETLEVELNWIPTVAGEYSLYAEVVMAGDEIDTNNQSQIINVTVLPAGLMSVTIGDGDQNARMPVDFYWKNSLFETIYFPDELGFVTGTINAVQLYNSFSSNISNTPIKIWMGSTNLPDLSDGYIPSTALNLVFDGNLNFPSGQNDVLVNLTTPYSHTPGNLVMMVERPMDTSYYSSSDYFKCQTVGSNRSRNATSDSENYDPANPPAGTLSGQFPKTTFFYTAETIGNDLGCLAITGSATPSVGTAYPYTITIKNNGDATQNNYQVKLMKAGDVELASVNGTTIESAETLEFTLDWTPTETGATYLYGKVVLAGDEIDSNNESGILNVQVYPEGTSVATIGEGGSTGRMPLDFLYKSSLFETIYLASEIGLEGDLIGVQFYSNFGTALEDMPFTLWLGETTQTDLSADWIPSTQLSMVFDGTMDFPTGANDLYIELPTPYAYGGGNLVLMALRPMDTAWYSGCNFVTQTGSVDARTRNLYSDSVIYDPAAPPTVTPSAIFPKTSLFFVEGGQPEELVPPTQLTATAVNNSYVSLDWLAPGDTPPPPPPTEIDEGFESYPDFALTFDPWVLVDVDGSGTYGVSGYSWPNVYSAMAYMIFNPS